MGSAGSALGVRKLSIFLHDFTRIRIRIRLVYLQSSSHFLYSLVSRVMAGSLRILFILFLSLSTFDITEKCLLKTAAFYV
jgi:hypothetical protein